MEIERVKEFKYLGRIISENDNDSNCIDYNLRKARQQWNSIAKLLKREGANAACMARFYMTVVQAVLLYGADSWTITKKDRIKLQSFHRRAIRYMCGSHIRKDEKGEWNYPNHKNLLNKCGLHSIDVYLEKRRGTLHRYLTSNRPNLLKEAETCGRHCKDIQKILWWKQSCHV